MPTTVEGLDDYTSGLAAASADLQALDLEPVTLVAAEVMRDLVPIQTRTLQRSIVATGDTLVIGARYAAARNRRPSTKAGFIQRTETVMATRAEEILEREWDHITERHNL